MVIAKATLASTMAFGVLAAATAHAGPDSALAQRYASPAAFSTRIELRLLDQGGQPVGDAAPDIMMMSYAAPDKLRVVSQRADLVSNGEKVILSVPSDRIFLMFDAPALPTSLALGDVNPVIGSVLPPMPLLDMVATGGSFLDGAAIDGGIVNLKMDGMDVLLVLDESGHGVSRSVLSGIDAENRFKLEARYLDQKWGEDAGQLDFPTAGPAGYADVTEQLTRSMRDPSQALVGKPAPDFRLPLLGGGEVALADQRGKVVVLDFWATWCAPCREALPKLQALATEMKDQPVVVWAMNLDEGPKREAAIEAFTSENDISLPQVIADDPDISTAYEVMGIPTTVVIGKDGMIHRIFSGYYDGMDKHLRDAVTEALAAEPAPAAE